MVKQNYEDYWKLTLAYTNFHDSKFLKTLQLVVDKIDELNKSGSYVYKTEDYQDLQQQVLKKVPKTATKLEDRLASTRKAINQCVKLGFVNSKLNSYHPDTENYLNAKTKRKRKTLFSKIVYSNSKFNSSTTNSHNWNQINFLIKTLEEVGKLNKRQLIAIMNVDIKKHKKGYITVPEIKHYQDIAEKDGFIERKYNQIGYLTNLLNKIEDIVFINDKLYFEDDAQAMFREELSVKTGTRDGYLHIIYKNQLKNETDEKLGDVRCMLENLSYPSLVASHIKPFIKSNPSEAYDPNNGLLLSRNMDILFDQGYISFEDSGKIILSDRLSLEVKKHLEKYELKNYFINKARKKYLVYHRDKVLRY